MSSLHPLREAANSAAVAPQREAAPALRVAPRPASRTPGEAFWSEYHRRRSMNHAALMLTARAVQAALDAGEGVDDGTRRRLRAALDEYEAVQRSLRERIGTVSADRG